VIKLPNNNSLTNQSVLRGFVFGVFSLQFIFSLFSPQPTFNLIDILQSRIVIQPQLMNFSTSVQALQSFEPGPTQNHDWVGLTLYTTPKSLTSTLLLSLICISRPRCRRDDLSFSIEPKLLSLAIINFLFGQIDRHTFPTDTFFCDHAFWQKYSSEEAVLVSLTVSPILQRTTF
jgi:hypothetical protein